MSRQTTAWYTDAVAPTVHGQWVTDRSTQSSRAFTYDEAGRLTDVTDVPEVGAPCSQVGHRPPVHV